MNGPKPSRADLRHNGDLDLALERIAEASASVELRFQAEES